MAQVRKYSKGNQVSKVKLFNYEGVGDFNIDDLTSAYANSINNELSQLDLGDEDKQKVLDITNDIMKNIQSGNIKGRNMSGHFLLPANSDLSSTGVNEKKKFLGISTGKYKKDDDFYKNTSYALLDKIFKNVPTYISKEEKKETPANYTLDFGKVMDNYYFNGKGFDPERWDYSNALNAVVARVDDEIKKVESGNYNNKEDILSRLRDTRAALLDNDPSNDAIVGSRIGFDFRPLFDKNYKKVRASEEKVEEPKSVEDAQKEEIQKERELARLAYETKTSVPSDLQTYFDPQTRKTLYGTFKNGIFFPSNNKAPIPVGVTWDSSNSNYYSENNLLGLLELINSGYYNDKIDPFYNSLKGKPLPETLKNWFVSYTPKNEKKEDPSVIHARKLAGENLFPSFLVPTIEKGSLQDKKIEFINNVANGIWNFLSTPNNNKTIIREKKGGVMKFQTPSGPITHIQAKDMSKWNRNNAISGYNMAKDIENYLKTGSDIDSYISAFNGGEDLYDKMVGNTDYFSGKNVNYVEKNPLAYQRQVTFRNTNKGFDDLIRGSIVGYGTTEGSTGYDTYLGDRTYNRTLGRITEDQANAFNTNQLNKYGIEFYLDPRSGHYRLRKTPVTTLPEVVVTPSSDGSQKTPVESNSLGKYTSLDSNKKTNPASVRWDEVIGTGRLLGTIMTNNSIAKGLKNSLSPLLLDPLQIRRQVTGDLATRNYMENLGAEANRIGNKPITSDANLALAQSLDFNNRAAEYRTKGYLADKEAIDRTTAEARQAAEQNQASRVDVANKNRASMLGIQQAKANIEAQRKSANWAQAIAPWLMDKEMKIAENRKINNELDYQENQYKLYNEMNSAVTMARKAMDDARSKYLSIEGNTEDGWENSQEYKNALSRYNQAINDASNNYKTEMLKARKNIYRYTPFLFTYKSGGQLSYSEKALLERAKDFNKSLLSDRKLFHKIVSDSQKENNKLIMSLSGLTKELIIKSMTI